jgi:hypothetical protein
MQTLRIENPTFISAALNLDVESRAQTSVPNWLSCVWETLSPKNVQFKSFSRAGMLSQSQGDFDRAEEFFESALELAEELYGASHYRTALVTLYLAKVSRLKGKHVEAALLRDRAQSVFSTSQAQPPAGGSAGFWSLLFS